MNDLFSRNSLIFPPAKNTRINSPVFNKLSSFFPHFPIVLSIYCYSMYFTCYKDVTIHSIIVFDFKVALSRIILLFFRCAGRELLDSPDAHRDRSKNNLLINSSLN